MKSALKAIKKTKSNSIFQKKLNADLIDGKISIGRHSNERNLNKMKNKKKSNIRLEFMHINYSF